MSTPGSTVSCKVENGMLTGFPLAVSAGDNINAWGGILHASPTGKFDSETLFFEKARGSSGFDINNVKEDGGTRALKVGDPVIFGVTTKDAALKYGKSTEKVVGIVSALTASQMQFVVYETAEAAMEASGAGLTTDQKRAKYTSDVEYFTKKLEATQQKLAALNLTDTDIPF